MDTDNNNANHLRKPLLFDVKPKSGKYLVWLYLLCKVLYFGNILAQMFAMNRVLGSNYHLYGIEVLMSWFKSEDWRMPERFPRATMCDLKIRRLGNVQRYTVQCVLPINLFNEMIFLLVWWILAFLAAYTLYCSLWWVTHLFSRSEDQRFLVKHLQYRGIKAPEGRDLDEDIKDFIKNHLRRDGVFVMRLIGINTDAVTVTDIVCTLFKEYYYPKPESNTESNPPS